MKLLVILLVGMQLCHAFPFPPRFQRRTTAKYTQGGHSLSLKKVLQPELRRVRKRQGWAEFQPVYNHFYYALPVSLGTQQVYLNADTGSADVWVTTSNLQCYASATSPSDFSDERDQSYCNFATTYVQDASYVQNTSLNLASGYYAGQVSGIYGSTPFTLAGVEAQATVGLALKTSLRNLGQPVMSGLLGLPHLAMSNAVDASGNLIQYQPPLYTLYQDNPSMGDYFAFTLSRDASNSGNGGLFTLGGVPDFSDPTVNVDANTYTVSDVVGDPELYSGTWSFHIDNWAIDNSQPYSQSQVVLIDSGSSQMWIPPDVAAAVNALWDSGINNNGVVDCNAQLTEAFSITIQGISYPISSEDLRYQNPDNGYCYTLVLDQIKGDAPILGIPFLKNVLGVFDSAASHVVLYPRPVYQS